MESIFITSVINVKENREVAAEDLPGAFLHAENDNNVIMFMRGRLAKLMKMLAPQTNQKYATIEKDQKVLYVKVQKALHGMLKRELLLYKKLRIKLENIGFEVNHVW